VDLKTDLIFLLGLIASITLSAIVRN